MGQVVSHPQEQNYIVETSFLLKTSLACLALFIYTNTSIAQQDLVGTYFFYSDKKDVYESIDLEENGRCRVRGVYGELWAQFCSEGNWKHYHDTVELTLLDCWGRVNAELGLNLKLDSSIYQIFTEYYLVKEKKLVGPLRKRRFNIFPDGRLRVYEFLIPFPEQLNSARAEGGHFDYQELPADTFFLIRKQHLDLLEMDSSLYWIRWWPDKDELKEDSSIYKTIQQAIPDFSKLKKLRLEYYDYDFWIESEHMAVIRMRKILEMVNEMGIPEEKIEATLFHAILVDQERKQYLRKRGMGKPFIKIEID